MSRKSKSLIMGSGGSFAQSFCAGAGRLLLFCITALPTVAIVFMIFFIAGEAMPFFADLKNTVEFFTGFEWRPSDAHSPHFGALSIFYGTVMVTLGSCILAVPAGIVAAVALSEISSPRISNIFKPIVELLAAIPSVVYGFFALVVFAPLLQENGGALLSVAAVLLAVPASILGGMCLGEFAASAVYKDVKNPPVKLFSVPISLLFLSIGAFVAYKVWPVEITSGTNALNASVILAVMALPTIVSLSQDALGSVGRDMREGSFALGATRAETIFKVVLPCAKSGIAVAVILGLMRVVGETMVVWMASGNALKIPEPFYNFLEPVRTVTATIAGEMGEADQSTGSARYHVLFALSFCLLVASLIFNAAGQWIGGGFKFLKK